jgi:hypothetical protein
MKEQDLIDLGFERYNVSAEESGDKPYFYFTYNITDELCLISTDSDEAERNGWYVELFDYENIEIQKPRRLKKLLLDIIERNKL